MSAPTLPPGIADNLILPAILALLATVVASGGVARILRHYIPVPLVQIALGAILGFATDLRLRIEPEMFLLLFLPPLLFLDAWRIPKAALRRDVRIVGELALGLVLATVCGLGLLVHWLIPAMPLALCFALGAVVSPTDAVAVGAITRRMPLPHRLHHILEGEALLNDASALVCVRFAAAALVTGSFVWSQALGSFLWLALAGLVIGAALAMIVGRVSIRLADRYGEEPGSHILVTLLLPFAAYALAELVHASGILAAVGAGFCMARSEARAARPEATRNQRTAAWDTIAFALNGSVFVLFGEQFSLLFGLVEPASRFLGAGGVAMLGGTILLLTAGLLALRAGWTLVSLWIDCRRAPAAHGFRRPPWSLVAANTLAGVRGTVTLVAALSLPRTYAGGSPIPGTPLVILCATGVALLTLILASVALPMVIRRLPVSLSGVGPGPAADRGATG